MNIVNQLVNLPYLSRRKRKIGKKAPKKKTFASGLLNSSNDSSSETMSSSETSNETEDTSLSSSSDSVMSKSYSSSKGSTRLDASILKDDSMYEDALSVYSMPVLF